MCLRDAQSTDNRSLCCAARGPSAGLGTRHSRRRLGLHAAGDEGVDHDAKPLMCGREACRLITACIMMQMHKGAELTLPFPDFGEPERTSLSEPLASRPFLSGCGRCVPLLYLPVCASWSHRLSGARRWSQVPLAGEQTAVDLSLRLSAASSARCDSLPGFVLLTLDIFSADVTSL